MDFDKDKFYLGRLCGCGHDYCQTGQTLRYLKGGKCIECKREKGKRYRQENHHKIKDRNKRYRQENFDKIKEANARYRQENIDRLKEYDRQYYRDNMYSIKEKNRRYQQNNPDKVKKYRKRHILKKIRLQIEKEQT